MYHSTNSNNAKEMVNGFDTNKMVKSHYHRIRYWYKGMYVSPEILGQFGGIIFKLALRTNNLHGTDYSANIGRPSDPQAGSASYDKEIAYRKKYAKEDYPNSFRPYLSQTLLQKTEPQALYRGIVSPDMILGVMLNYGDNRGKWLTRKQFMKLQDIEDEGFDLSSPNYTIDQYLDFIGGGKRDRERIVKILQMRFQWDKDPTRRDDNVDKALDQFGFGASAKKSLIHKFKRKYGDGTVKTNPALNNPLSSIVYHKTSLHKAAQIVRANELYTSPAFHGTPDQTMGAKDFYFVSFMRSPQSGYSEGGYTYVLFEFDGRKLNTKYKGEAVDYWGREARLYRPTSFEMEDRLYTSQSFIPDVLKYINAIHIGMVDSEDGHRYGVSRERVDEIEEILEIGKRHKVPVYIYLKESSWKRLKPPRFTVLSSYISAAQKKGVQFAEERLPSRTSSFDEEETERFAEWAKLAQATVQWTNHRSLIAFNNFERNQGRYGSTYGRPYAAILYTWQPKEMVSRLSNLVHNNKGKIRGRLWYPEITKAMKALKVKTLTGLVDKMSIAVKEDDQEREKWKRSESARKNPALKVGDRIKEGGKTGKVVAFHTAGTVDVKFDGERIVKRRQMRPLPPVLF